MKLSNYPAIFILLFLTYTVQAEVKIPKGIIKLDGRSAPALILKNMDDESYNIEQSKGNRIQVEKRT